MWGWNVVVPADAGTQRGEVGGGWIPAPRFHEDKLRRKDGGAPQERRWNHVVPADAGTQRGEVGRGFSRAPGMDSCSPFPRGQASQERRWGAVVVTRRGGSRTAPTGSAMAAANGKIFTIPLAERAIINPAVNFCITTRSANCDSSPARQSRGGP